MAEGALARIDLTGAPLQLMAHDAPGVLADGLLGIDVSAGSVEGTVHTVVQVMLDDDRPGFDRTLLDGPLLADVIDAGGSLVARELLDHDRFRRELLAEREQGVEERRGVLVLTGGEPPPPWIRLAFLPVALPATARCSLVVARSTAEELLAGVEAATGAGEMTDDERAAAVATIGHLHPGPR